MRILFVAHTYPRWSGDRAGAQVYRFARAAQERGHQVLVVAPHATGALEGEETLDGVKVRRFRYASDANERIGYQGAIAKSIGNPAALLTLPGYLLKFRSAVRDAVREFVPDVVSVHWWAPGGLATDGLTVPVAITCHGSDVRLLTTSFIARTMGRPVLRRASAVSAVSALMAKDIAEQAGRSDVEVTRMPVDDARFVPAGARGTPPLILFAGNIIHAKGVDLILRAAAELHRRGVQFRLRPVGYGPDRPEYERLSTTLGIGGLVEWGGPKAHDEMPGEFSRASIFVLASRGPRGEGLPLTVAEALLTGCAVVSTPAGGVPEIVVDGETGLIARDDNATHLAEQLGRLLADPALQERLGVAGRSRALEQHGARRANDHFFAFLGDAIRKGGGR